MIHASVGQTGIHVAEYLTLLPPREELARNLLAAEHARARLRGTAQLQA